MKKLSVVLFTLLLNLFAFGQDQTIVIREHERENGSTFTTAEIKTEGEQFTQKGFAEGTGDQSVLDAIKNAQNSGSGAQKQSSNIKAGPDGQGDYRTGGPIIVITIGNPSKPGPKLPRGVPYVQYDNQEQFRKAFKVDLAKAMQKG